MQITSSNNFLDQRESSLQILNLIQDGKENPVVDFSFLCHPFDSPTSTSKKNYKNRFKPIPENSIVPNDYSRIKVNTQIPANIFWASVDLYLRPITDDDLQFLENYTDPKVNIEIGPKGQNYIAKWAKEESSLYPDLIQASKLKFSIFRLISSDNESKLSENKPILLDQLDDDELIHPSVSCPPLTERLLASLIDQRLLPSSELDKINNPTKDHNIGEDYNQVPNLEDRIKQELFYIGAIDKKEIDWNEAQDDEVSVEIRRLSKILQSQIELNNSRKKKLFSVVREYLGFQEYRTIIDELDKQIESNYSKRSRNQKSKKRKSIQPKGVSVSTNTMALIERRRRFIDSIGILFKDPKFVNPTTNIFDPSEQNQFQLQ
ncbi:Chromatin-remodeling complexes subunit ngg1 [Smittium culicis]|uniref:Chromatin-remodeling complexes subunit ngg1 n=1 Tax=Smittium culicis TaxID=133412 RepID=A0A1R1Y4V5_9FUNG|nr:Chromatin-remodeling complexes subunit ngg1 [Smittium culicis]